MSKGKKKEEEEKKKKRKKIGKSAIAKNIFCNKETEKFAFVCVKKPFDMHSPYSCKIMQILCIDAKKSSCLYFFGILYFVLWLC